jgi:REP element-mobilizing transposase RayT
MKKNYVNTDHAHALIDLPTNFTLESLAQVLKGSSSHWINQNHMIRGKFAWARGYAIFSVSHLKLDRVDKYIENQHEHHRKKTFIEEYQKLISAHNLVYLKSD